MTTRCTKTLRTTPISRSSSRAARCREPPPLEKWTCSNPFGLLVLPDFPTNRHSIPPMHVSCWRRTPPGVSTIRDGSRSRYLRRGRASTATKNDRAGRLRPRLEEEAAEGGKQRRRRHVPVRASWRGSLVQRGRGLEPPFPTPPRHTTREDEVLQRVSGDGRRPRDLLESALSSPYCFLAPGARAHFALVEKPHAGGRRRVRHGPRRDKIVDRLSFRQVLEVREQAHAQCGPVAARDRPSTPSSLFWRLDDGVIDFPRWSRRREPDRPTEPRCLASGPVKRCCSSRPAMDDSALTRQPHATRLPLRPPPPRGNRNDRVSFFCYHSSLSLPSLVSISLLTGLPTVGGSEFPTARSAPSPERSGLEGDPKLSRPNAARPLSSPLSPSVEVSTRHAPWPTTGTRRAAPYSLRLVLASGARVACAASPSG